MSSQSASHNALGSGPRAASRMDLSGHERDKMYLSRAAKDVVELSYLSGADGLEDARAFAKADLDRDGFEDMIVVNRNAPLLRVYRNQLGPSTKRHFVGFRVEGRKQAEAIGARLAARGCGMTQTREIAAGSGFGVVNGLVVTLGLGDCATLDEVTVHFPQGESRTFQNVAADKLYRVVEGKGIKELPGVYGPKAAPAPPSVAANASGDAGRKLRDLLPASARGNGKLVLVELFATWCEACKRQNPRLDALTSTLGVVGVSIEPKDSSDAVRAFAAKEGVRHPLLAYQPGLANAVAAVVGSASPPLPSSIALDAQTGRVLWAGPGVPTRSDLLRWQWQGP